MRLRDTQRVQALRGMQRFLDDHHAELEGCDSGGARPQLDEITARLDKLAVAQGSLGTRARGERLNEAKLAEGLRRMYFRPIKAIDNGFKQKGTLSIGAIPFPHRRPQTTRLVMQARALIAVLQPHEAAFVAAGMGPGFLEMFEEDVAELEGSTSIKGRSQAAKVGATAAVARGIKRARLVVATIDSLVVAHLGEGHPLLGEWRPLVRAFRNAGRKRKAAKRPGEPAISEL